MLALTDSAPAPACHLRHGPKPDRRPVLELLAFCRDAAGARRNGGLTVTIRIRSSGATHA